ncbi:S-adenosyl-L-methionine-dependent methyltransferase [Penicillium hordei]|uniref:S-adenosyl-L-methionine-dependent methyltransferase n=1 Tax=Penicillium hordei TaxID=40994 RepID=A0AAD6GX92_9EURO|nr:S-adenosyl-L-methionine-dependent methyltransferase [Penicillium hordei]KAJ5592635.1 S-adenosyl-L-methionine-dependent methyltransferase [Penicillium hordei]
MNLDTKIFAQDKEFWNNYLKGRPQAPESFFNRIFNYHESHGGVFGTVHDAGAGNGPYSQKLRSRFQHVIVSDIVAKNVGLAEDRLGTDGFSYRTAKVEEVDDILPGSVDMVFATNVMHFPDQQVAMAAIAQQLKAGGTFACGSFGPARFYDAKLQDLWQRISHEGGRQLLKKPGISSSDTIRVLARTGDANMAPLDPEVFVSGAQRVHLNFRSGGITGLLPPEAYRKTEPNFTGPDDEVLFEDEEGWSFEKDLDGIKEHFCSFPFVAENLAVLAGLFAELDELLGDGRVVRGYFPAQIILATRR